MNTRKKWYSRVFALAIALALAASFAVPAMAPLDVSADPGSEWDWEWPPEVSGPEWLIAPNSEIYDFAADPAGDIIYAVGMGADMDRFNYCGATWTEATARLWKSEDGAVTWDDITDEITDNTDFDPETDVLLYVALAPDDDDMVFVATATEVYGSNEGGDDFSTSELTDKLAPGESILCLAVSCEVDDDYNVAVGTSAGNVWRLVTGGFLGGAWEVAGGLGGYDGWQPSVAVTSVAFSPNFDADDTILAITTGIGMQGSTVEVTSNILPCAGDTEDCFDNEPHTTVVDPVAFDAQSGPVTIEGEISGLDLGPTWPNTAYLEIGVRPEATKNERNAGVYFIIFKCWGEYSVDISDYTGQKVGNKVDHIPLSDSFSYRITLNPDTASGIGGTADLELWNADGGKEVDIHDFPYGYASTWEEDVAGDLNEDYSNAHLFYSIIADRKGTGGVTYSATVGDITTDGDATYLQTGRLGNVEQWNYIAGSAFEDPVKIVDAPPLWTDRGGATGIALSADYDGRKSGLRYTWVYVDYVDTDMDPDAAVGRVFQIDNDDVDYAGIPCDPAKFSPMLASISAYGTEEEGKLMVGLLGDYDTGEPTDCSEGVEVYYTTMPIDTCCPDWDSSDKPPTGQSKAIVSYVSDGDKAYAATMGKGRADEGAFSVSEIEEVGLYWNQYSLIDTDIDYLSDFAIVQDCWNSGQYFVASINLMQEDEEEGIVAWPNQVCECDSVWYSEDWGEHYMRVWCGEFTANDVNVAFEGDVTDQIGFIRLSPEEGSWVETLYVVDRGTETVWWNDSSGLTDWSEQSTCTLDAISDLAVADPSTIYAVSATTAEVAKSTDDGESWDDPVDADMVSGEVGHTIAVNGDDVLFGSDAGSVSYSEDGGETFDILAWEQAVGYGNVHVAFDAYYRLNDTVYAAVGDGGNIYRWPIGSSTTGGNWEKLDASPTLTQMGGSGDDEIDVDYYGVVSKSSGMCDADDGAVLYAAYAYSYEDTNPKEWKYYTGVARCLTPAADLCCGEADWDYLHTGLITGAEDQWFPQQFTTEPSSLKVAGTPSYIWIDAIDNLSVYADIIINDLDDGYGCYYAYDYWWGLGQVYCYQDCFAEGGVSLSAPGSGSLIPSDPCFCWNEKFVLKWEQPCDGCLYDVQIALDEDFNDIYLEELNYDPPSARNPSLVILDGDLDCSTTYYWRVRSVEADTGEVVRSWWSVAWDFAVAAGPAGAIRLTAPVQGATDVPVAGAVFTWTSVAGAETYDFSLMDASGTEVDSQTGLTGTSYAYTGTLGLDTAYTWQVTAMKGTGMSKSDTVSVSRVSTFRTVSAAVFTCPQCGLTFATEADLEAHIADAHPVREPTTPSWVWVIIGLGAVLVITVIVLIFRTRRV